MLLKNVQSDYYGNIVYRLAGILDLKKIYQDDKIDFLSWLEKYHHKKFFSSPSILLLEKNNHNINIGCESYAIFVPLLEDNKDWTPSENNTYYQYWIKYKTKHQKELPIAEKTSTLLMWQNSLPEILIPDYFGKISSIEDLHFFFERDRL